MRFSLLLCLTSHIFRPVWLRIPADLILEALEVKFTELARSLTPGKEATAPSRRSHPEVAPVPFFAASSGNNNNPSKAEKKKLHRATLAKLRDQALARAKEEMATATTAATTAATIAATSSTGGTTAA